MIAADVQHHFVPVRSQAWQRVHKLLLLAVLGGCMEEASPSFLGNFHLASKESVLVRGAL